MATGVWRRDGPLALTMKSLCRTTISSSDEDRATFASRMLASMASL